MLIEDHINAFGTNPLVGANDEDLGPRFPDMSDAYRKDLRAVALAVARRERIPLKHGVYVGVHGPSYETPAEIRAFRALGAHAVGMSTVPEVIALNQMGVGVVGISCITNMAAGVFKQKLVHPEVLETTQRVKGDFVRLLTALVQALGSGRSGATEDAFRRSPVPRPRGRGRGRVSATRPLTADEEAPRRRGAEGARERLGAVLRIPRRRGASREDGTIFSGCNVESASYGLTVCGERTAVFKAISEGARSFAPSPSSRTPTRRRRPAARAGRCSGTSAATSTSFSRRPRAS